jgi:SAM-dependent methyltransferase
MKSIGPKTTAAARRLLRTIARVSVGTPDADFPLSPPLPLPDGVSEAQFYAFLESTRVADAPAAEMQAYCRSDFRRFVYTWGLARNEGGRALELGANPYFTTMLLREFTTFELTLANFFQDTFPAQGRQDVVFTDFRTKEASRTSFDFDHFNIENTTFPYDDASFDVVFFCEIIEHLLMDPLRVLREISRVLRPNGSLILTTPNVARLENVARMLSGANIYDPYSGYGPYGRHNREYNRHELHLLLTYAGFQPEEFFTADVHPNNAYTFAGASALRTHLAFREHDLGQYLFTRSRRIDSGRTKKPAFLYRSVPAEALEPWPGPSLVQALATVIRRATA